jgi:hypothetical protein
LNLTTSLQDLVLEAENFIFEVLALAYTTITPLIHLQFIMVNVHQLGFTILSKSLMQVYFFYLADSLRKLPDGLSIAFMHFLVLVDHAFSTCHHRIERLEHTLFDKLLGHLHLLKFLQQTEALTTSPFEILKTLL